jgi:hypothetical protein
LLRVHALRGEHAADCSEKRDELSTPNISHQGINRVTVVLKWLYFLLGLGVPEQAMGWSTTQTQTVHVWTFMYMYHP